MNPIPPDHPYRREFARLEKDAAAAIADALADLRKDLFRGITRESVFDIMTRLRSTETNEALRQKLYTALLPTLDLGTAKGRELVEREVLGVKFTLLDPGFNWELVNEAAREWLKRHTFMLTYANVWSITQSTEKLLRRAIDDFITAPGMTINQLSRSVADIFDFARAETIAVTEVTRTFAEANLEAWRGSGVVERKRWNTAKDELVCPVCAPLNGKAIEIGELFNGFVDGPPAHPRCRCWVTPVVTVPDEKELDRLQNEVEIMDSLREDVYGFDRWYDNINPPEGRAPRGMGQEYDDRRAIVRMIRFNSNNQAKLQANIDKYRGQLNRRYDITVMQARIQELNKAITASIEIAESPYGEWGWKRDMVKEIFAYVSELTGR